MCFESQRKNLLLSTFTHPVASVLWRNTPTCRLQISELSMEAKSLLEKTTGTYEWIRDDTSGHVIVVYFMTELLARMQVTS